MSDCGGDCGGDYGNDGGGYGGDTGNGSYGGDYGGGHSGGTIEIKSSGDDYGGGHSGGSIEIKSCGDDYGGGHSGSKFRSGSCGDVDVGKDRGGKTESGDCGGDIGGVENYHHGSANVWLHDDDPCTYKNVYTSPHTSYYRPSQGGVGRVGSGSDCFCSDRCSQKCIIITVSVVTGILIFYVILLMIR